MSEEEVREYEVGGAARSWILPSLTDHGEDFGYHSKYAGKSLEAFE